MIRDHIEALPLDSWRRSNPFSADMVTCHEVLFRAGASRREMGEAIDAWLATQQPCLFGRMEAKQSRLAYCLLTENDLERGDDHVRARIQSDRHEWRQAARRGASHGFIIVAVSHDIATATVGPELLALTRHLCHLYISQDQPDEVFHDSLLLETRHGGATELWEWKVGVNFFSAQGDGRWWRDHRFPGGVAFSMNSVGHMARHKAEEMLRRDSTLAAELADVPRGRLVYWALPTAMRTISPPVQSSGRGTWLAQRDRFPEDIDPPTFEVRERVFRELVGYSENRYLGAYHTDETIPTPYFDPGITSLETAGERDDLFFTYLHSPRDEAYLSMGTGTLARAIEEEQTRQSEGRSEP